MTFLSHVYVVVLCLSLPLPFSIKSINISLDEDLKKNYHPFSPEPFKHTYRVKRVNAIRMNSKGSPELVFWSRVFLRAFANPEPTPRLFLAPGSISGLFSLGFCSMYRRKT